MKVALYLRVSTKEQTENYSLSNQEDKLRAYCKAKDWEVFDVYKDGGFSGADIDRPDLQRMLTDVKQNRVDAVMVYKLDRLSRSQRDTLELIEDHFLTNKIDFISVTESLDTSTPMGRAMTGIMSAFAQLERELIAERMRDGQIKRAEAGYAAMGGNYEPAGFERIDGKLITVEEEKEHILTAFKLYAKYHSITKVQHELKLLGYPVWRFRRYRDILRNPLYNGKFTFSQNVYEGKHEKIIEDDLFNTVQKLIKRHRGHNFNKAKESLLAGMMTCSMCGERYLTYTTADKRGDEVRRYRYYICRARRFPSEYDKKCMNKIWNAQKLEELIRNEVKLLSVDKEEVIRDDEKRIDYVQLINNVNKKIERLIDLYAEGNIDKGILDKRMVEYNSEKEDLMERRLSESTEITSMSTRDIKNYVIDLKQAGFRTKRAIIEKLITQMYIDHDNISIEWSF